MRGRSAQVHQVVVGGFDAQEQSLSTGVDTIVSCDLLKDTRQAKRFTCDEFRLSPCGGNRHTVAPLSCHQNSVHDLSFLFYQKADL